MVKTKIEYIKAKDLGKCIVKNVDGNGKVDYKVLLNLPSKIIKRKGGKKKRDK